MYLTGGILFNKYHKRVKTFRDVIPNHLFWAELPSLAKVRIHKNYLFTEKKNEKKKKANEAHDKPTMNKQLFFFGTFSVPVLTVYVVAKSLGYL